MKQRITLVTFFLLCTLSLFAGKIITKDKTQLPEPAQNFIESYFKKYNVKKIEIKDNWYKGKTYKVEFTNDYKVKFDKNGDWVLLDYDKNAVPKKFIPESIQNYIDVNFKGDHVVKIDREKSGYKIELQTDVEILFNEKGQFKKFD